MLTILIFSPGARWRQPHIFGWRPTKMANHGELIQPPKAGFRGASPARCVPALPEMVAADRRRRALTTACVELAEQSRAIQVSLNPRHGGGSPASC